VKINKYSSAKQFRFSFVMPVFNVEPFLCEAVDSILNQSMDFEQYVQLIFINDGSTDDSEAICQEYKERYPKNITYIKQENQGVSAARNAGMECADGKYISFLDSDDAISADTLDKVYSFFESHYDEVDVVSIKLEFFESKTGSHPLNYKYSSTRVVNILQEYSSIQLSGGSAFVKSEALKNKYSFDERLSVSEDATLLTKVILNKLAYGVVQDPTYYYRKRIGGDSAIGASVRNRSWYFNTPSYCYQHLLDYSILKCGFIPKYVQYLIMYDLGWRYTQSEQSILNKNELKEYRLMLTNLLQSIDDDVIVAQKNIQSEHKLFMLKDKYGKNFDRIFKRIRHSYYVGEVKLYDYNWKLKFLIELTNVKDGRLTIEGRLWALLLPGVEFGFLDSGNFYPAERVFRPQLHQKFLGNTVSAGFGYKITLPMRNGATIKAVLRFTDGSTRTLGLVSGSMSRLQDFTGRPYRAVDGYLICQPDIKTIAIQYNTVLNLIKKEIKYLQFYLRPKTKELTGRVSPVQKNFLHELLYSPLMFRLCFLFTKPIFKKTIWIISDRSNSAGDNGEAFYLHMAKKQTNVRVYFAIRKASPDYNRLRKAGKVINRDSWYYRLLFLHSSKIISSHAEEYVINPFGDKQAFLRDLFKFEYVFLQHGVTMNNLDGWLNRYNKDISLFITSSPQERASILDAGYHYTYGQVRLTGMPRYDLLKSEPEKVIIIAPTWRKKLSTGLDINNERPYSSNFKKSYYFEFFNNMLNDEKIVAALEKHNASIEFYLHPSLSEQATDFKSSGRVTIMSPPYDYRDAFRRGCMLVTDYSSVAFDFGYLKKPVIYSHFDRESFYDGQMYSEGYFSYEKNGFGPVLYEYSATIRSIIDFLEKKCEMEAKYINRVNDFFMYTDKNNSERVYRAICDMGTACVEGEIND
jgi:glycosyltransferase involved in cell wall biosynthesis/CDP-glycerol glycerophosphotransferase (TagB/SpsB family)